MTLTPEARVVLTEALRPPAGFRVDLAVGTTYTLDLTALLAAPLAFAISDELSTGEPKDPIRLLDAVRRHADRTTVFCQAGGIHVPAYRRIMTFIEDGVVEVTAPSVDAVFHPKVWALRFEDTEGAWRHRVVVLSRNLTFDRSWDTALVLDEAPDGTIPAAPAAAFLRALPSLAVRPVAPGRARHVEELAATLAVVNLAAPGPFTGGELLPLGTGTAPWPFERGRKLLVISPFLTRGVVHRLGDIAQARHLISQPHTLDQVGPEVLDGWSTWALQPLVEGNEPDEPADPVAAQGAVGRDGFLERGTGLHAKTVIVDELDGHSITVTGSANLTGAGWERNVEFDAILRGPTSDCGVDVTFEGGRGTPGLLQVLVAHTASSATTGVDEEYEAARRLERFHQALAESAPGLTVVALGDDRVSATLHLDLPDESPGYSVVRLLSLPGDAHARELAAQVEWTLAQENVTAFLVVETTTEQMTRRCVLIARLSGDLGDRRQGAVMSVLANRRDVLRYLIFLLGDPSYDTLLEEAAGSASAGGAWSARGAVTQAALFEPLVRAAGRDPEALARVAGLIGDLRALPDAEKLIPEGFDEMWEAVWQAHVELG